MLSLVPDGEENAWYILMYTKTIEIGREHHLIDGGHHQLVSCLFLNKKAARHVCHQTELFKPLIDPFNQYE